MMFFISLLCMISAVTPLKPKGHKSLFFFQDLTRTVVARQELVTSSQLSSSRKVQVEPIPCILASKRPWSGRSVTVENINPVKRSFAVLVFFLKVNTSSRTLDSEYICRKMRQPGQKLVRTLLQWASAGDLSIFDLHALVSCRAEFPQF